MNRKTNSADNGEAEGGREGGGREESHLSVTKIWYFFLGTLKWTEQS